MVLASIECAGLRQSVRQHGQLMLALVFAAGLAACNSDTALQGASLTAPAVAPITADELVGKWGLGSFRTEADLARTTNEARRYCSNPYVIGKGTNGGVMMYLADQTQPSEVFIKSAGGRVYIGPPGPAGVKQDRQVTSFENGVLVAAWVDPTVTARYGTMVFVRCDTPAAPAKTAAAVAAPATTAAPVPAPPPATR
ncbi:hypothetical protein SAMN02745157_0238 [Kaistia soli DSM 19436]|uniref:Uncharacterized protein n=1 Tax=Kaistia soli DSM 19436 TaxID=1122133 RepID=A0A1M5PTR8_9HYPH|nr:hypothetical protein [Kaistia soli]SHH04956.1 hypothetical protein SAMN02745157_0238 [Kaistia soli DSM 19436]